MRHFFLPCPRGAEEVLATEMRNLGAFDVRTTPGGAQCQAPLDWAYTANLHSRVASRVLLQVARAPYRNEEDIYAHAHDIDWTQWFDVSLGIKVHVEGRRAPVRSLEFITLKIKDAVCDVFRSKTGLRPNVRKDDPDLRIHAFLDEKTVQFFLDTSGEALFKRGYRQETGIAPLRENLAAAMLLLADASEEVFYDPFCGSGTLAIEAALISSHSAPGLNRRFGFEKLKFFDASRWADIKNQARAAIRPIHGPIFGVDKDAAAIAMAKRNAQAAGVGQAIQWRQANALSLPAPAATGVVVSNPPYGVRLDELDRLRAWYPELGAWLKQNFSGWTVNLLSADKELPRGMRLSPKRKTPLYNGALDCRLYQFPMVQGSNRSSA